MTIRLRVALVALLALLAPSLASAEEWPSEVRRKFVDQCLASCNTDKKLTAIQRVECPPYCECMVKEAQGVLSIDDYTALQDAAAAKKPDPRQDRYDAFSTTCRRVFR